MTLFSIDFNQELFFGPKSSYNLDLNLNSNCVKKREN